MTTAQRERLAGGILLLGVVYLVFEGIAAVAWVDPPYDWARNYISDLGFADCAVVDGDRICSPLHPLMNAAFMIQGTVFTVGAILVCRILFPAGPRRTVTAAFLVASGVGTFFVGVFFQSLALSAAGLNWIHLLAATVAIGAGNIGLLLFAVFAIPLPPWRAYAIGILVIGIIGIASSVVLALGIDFGLGIGLIERVAVYPLNAWTVGTGVGLLLKNVRDHRRHVRAIAGLTRPTPAS